MNHEEGLPSRKPLSISFLIACATGFCVVLVIISFFVWQYQLSSKLENRLRKIRGEGYPTNAREWSAFYKTPDDDVTELWRTAVGDEGIGPLSGPAYNLAIQALPLVGPSDEKIPPPGMEWPELADARKLLEQYEGSLLKMHEAAQKGGAARYPRDTTKGFAMLLPEVGPLRNGARLLSLEAHVRAHEGNAHGAAESIHTIFGMAKSLDNEPILISWLVRSAIHSMGIKLLRDLLPHLQFSDSDLKLLQVDLRSVENAKMFTNVMAGERALGIDTMNNPGTALSDSPQSKWMVSNEDRHFYLDHFELVMAAAEEGWPKAIDMAEQAEQDMKKRLQDTRLAQIRMPLTALMAPAVTSVFQATARLLANCRAADTAIAVTLFQREHGRLPKTLDELVPTFLSAVSVDPFDGMPLKYRTVDGGFIVYSIGKDRKDNGGVEQKAPADEIVFPVLKDQQLLTK